MTIANIRIKNYIWLIIDSIRNISEVILIMQDIEQNTKNLGYNISNAYKNDGFIRTGSLIRKQKKQLKFIKKVYAKALFHRNNTGEANKILFLPVHFEWLTDNYYIIERELKNICKSLNYVAKLPAAKKISGTDTNTAGNEYSQVKIYAFLYELASNSDVEITPSILEEYIESAQSNGNYFSINELSLVRIMLSAAICEKIYNISGKLYDYLNKKVDTLPDSYAYSLGYCIRNLRFCSIYKFENLFEKCSRVEEIFNRDPAGIYKNMTAQTKDYYRKRLYEIAKERNLDEITAAENIYFRSLEAKNRVELSEAETETEKKSHIGYELMKKKTPRKAYFINMIALFVFFLAILFLSLDSKIAVLLLSFPLWELAKQLTDFIFARLIDVTPLPRLALEDIPADKKTLVCVATLLFGEGKDGALFDRLEMFYHCNKSENIKFAVLGDLKDNEAAVTESDEKIIEYAERRIAELNAKYNNAFALFIRDRTYAKSEDRYMGWERKRGALLELVRFIKNIRTTIAIFCGDINFIRDVKYIITLDADTNLGIDDAKDMLSAMLHPYAKPVFDAEKKIVTDGYGIMQPRMGTELSAASKTPFTRLLSGCGGIDIYASAAFDLYQEIYEEGNFCGKGIFDVDIFHRAIDKAYPEASVLSHDLIEGTRLRAALISDIELTDGIPKNPLSYFDRQHRWIRGDVQALQFIGGTVKNADGEKIKNPINKISKYKIFDNVRRASLPIFALIILAAVIINRVRLPLSAAVIAVMYIIFPVIITALSIFFVSSYQNVYKRFSSKVMTSIWKSVLGSLVEFSALAYNAHISFDAILRTVFRLCVTKKKTLSWFTASESEMQLKGLALYVKKMFISSLIGAAFVFFAPYGALKILGFMWLVFPVTAYLMGKEDDGITERDLNEKQKARLNGYVADMWKFYANTVGKTDNFLPPDNIQLFPIEAKAHRTSPTNIGLYMLSVLSARDFALIDTKAMHSKLELTLSTVERLAKWNGHLYNWYDTKTLNIIGSKFISTVDSGNFAACLTSLKEGLREYETPEHKQSHDMANIIRRIEKILDEMDFSALYNKTRDLFYIGYDEVEDNYGENCYDLYMSEAKITSYFAIARRDAPKKHWQKLGRTLIKENGYMGLASWTGTAFEYFMPNLLLPLYKNSLTYEAHRFALREQMKRRAKYNDVEVWGISESGFYAFDFEMNYQYQAFGVQKLGLKRGLNKDLVISPYSAFLALSISPYHAMNNLARLEKIGMYGKYGFYEACDFTGSRVGNTMSVVRSYMAHHVGMSIIAAANVCFDNIFVKRFINDKIQWSATELLQEKIPVDAIIFEDINESEIPEKINRSYGLIEKNSGRIELDNPVCKLLSNSKSKIVLSSTGHVMLSDGAYTLNYEEFDRYNNLRPFAVMFKYKDEVLSPAKIPINRPNAEYMYEFTDTCATYSIKDIINSPSSYIIGEAKYSVFADISCYSVNLSVNVTDIKNSDSPAQKNITYKQKNNAEPVEAILYFEPVLTMLADFMAHPAFSSLSIEAEYDEKNKILFYKRRPRLESEVEKWLAIDVSCAIENGKHGRDMSLDFEFESRRDDILPHAYGEKDIANLFSREFTNTTGACINPVCAIKIKLPSMVKNHYQAKFNIAFADKKEDAVNILQIANKLSADSEKEKERQKIVEKTQNRLIVSKLSPKEKNLLDIILSCIYCKTANNKPDKADITGLSASIKLLWKEGISGDLPIILLSIKDEKKADVIIEEYLHVHKYLTLSSQKLDLIIIFTEKEKYNRPCQNNIRELIKKNNCEQYLNRKGGIYLLDRANLEPAQIQLINAMASYKYEVSGDIQPPVNLHGHDIHDAIERIPEIKTSVSVEENSEDNKDNKDNEENHGYKNIVFDEPVYSVEGGYFTEAAFYIDCKNKKAPWSHIITNKQFGTLITHKSLGFTWYSNARERRLTAWENDSVLDMQSERIILNLRGVKYDLCAIASHLKISACGGGEYYGKILGYEYKITVSVDDKLFIKLVEVVIYPRNIDGEVTHETSFSKDSKDSEVSAEAEEVELSYLIKPVMGVAESKNNFIYINDLRSDTAAFRNVCNVDFNGYNGFIRAIGGKIKTHDMMDFLTDSKYNLQESDCIAVSKYLILNKSDKSNKSESKAVFALGCYKDMRYFDYVYKKLNDMNFIDSMPSRFKNFISDYLPEIKLTSQNKALDIMINLFTPYQNISARKFGRTGFYQSSGAYGYRDQLQDTMGLVYSCKQLVSTHIYRAAAHQFIEGDVQHWWHGINSPDDNAAHRGVRTRCSDDYLWLPYVTAFYINKTGDANILDKMIEYITDAPLKAGEIERYSEPKKSGIKGSVYEHCKKSIEYGFKFGTHDLPLIGSCDWNDGFSLVGAEGRGESVWLAFFMILVIENFVPIMELRGDSEAAERYRGEVLKLREAIEKHCYEDDRYIRGFYDDGTKLGSKDSDECQIDILPQAFAAITAKNQHGTGDLNQRIKKALNTAYDNLFDKKYKILKLFTPPFVDSVQNPGYIKSYVAGIRENGGQYTHVHCPVIPLYIFISISTL